MTKFYVPALALALVGSGAHAQSSTGVEKQSKRNTGATVKTRYAESPRLGAGAQRDAFWSEDFSGGDVPAGWTNVDDLTPVGETPVTFVWSNDPLDVDVAALGNTEIENFMSATATNGYLWANSDRGLPSAPAENHLTRLTTTAIDCSGQTSVLFSMQSTIGVFDNNASEFVKLRVSTNLVDWTDFFPFPCLETGAIAPPCGRFSNNPDIVNVDITSAAANQPTVYLQFEWQGGWEYYWAIDDLALTSLPDYEIEMNYAYTSTTGTGEEYGRIPSAQLPDMMNVGAELFNLGLGEQTGVAVNVAFSDADGNPIAGFDNSIGVAPIQSGETVVGDGNINFPSGVGLYNVAFSVTSDNIALDLDPTNNSAARNYEVTDDVYSVDAIGNHPDGTEQLQQYGTATWIDNTEVYYMSMYIINSTMDATGVIVELGPASVAADGASMEAFLVDTVDVIQLPATVSNWIDGVTSGNHVITQADVDAGTVGLQFSQPVTLNPGAYFAVVRVSGSGTITSENSTDGEVYILDDNTVPQPAWTSAMYLPIDFNDDGTEGRHSYTNGTAYAIRLTSNTQVGVNEASELTGVSIFPNPTNGVFQISSDRTDVLFVEVTDALGKVVHKTNFSALATIDLSELSAGIYSVAVSSATERTVQRVTIK